MDFKFKSILFFTLVFFGSGCTKETTHRNNRGLITSQAMVVSARKEASEIGIQIMQQGGNAFDAMIATEMALAVTFPYAGNLGGGGFMVYRLKDGKKGALDFREKAPLAAHRDMYLDAQGNVNSTLSTTGATAVGVPGTVAGIFAVHKKFGSLPIEQILTPVIQLAEQGVPVTEKQAARLARYQEKFIEINGKTIPLSADFKPGDMITYPALANTLKRLAKNGRDEFYQGETAKEIAKFIQIHGGYITEQDLAEYEAIWREPITFNYKDLSITSMSLPSSGGITLNQIFSMLEPYNLAQHPHNSLPMMQLLVEAERRAFADRSEYLGDPDFIEIPEDLIKSKDYLQKQMATFSFDSATPSTEVGNQQLNLSGESTETTHYSIVDPFGNAVSVTTTLNGGYGSKLYSEKLGFFFNNEMDDFSAKPGVPNMFGLVGGEANAIAPGKRMLSSMSPTIVEKNNDLYMVIGTPGGPTIITSILQTILNVYEYGMTMQEAVNAPRFHHQWLPDKIILEEQGFSDEQIAKLESKGYKAVRTHFKVIGKVDAILKLEDHHYEGGADYRGDDTAVGF